MRQDFIIFKHNLIFIFKVFTSPPLYLMLLQEVFADFALKFGGSESATSRLCCEKEPMPGERKEKLEREYKKH